MLSKCVQGLSSCDVACVRLVNAVFRSNVFIRAMEAERTAKTIDRDDMMNKELLWKILNQAVFWVPFCLLLIFGIVMGK